MTRQTIPLKHTVNIEALAYGGDSVGYVEGRPVFIPGCVPGDVTETDILQDKGSFLRGISTKLISLSPNRVEPFCPLAQKCGGCQWQSVQYESQLIWKQKIVRETLRRIGGIVNIEVEPCL
ncbi:MAG: TRAM domain-containing protein, partial [Candidatus Latescibacteria bacterium]|nr:TRAM domain-containing protein [Candidatus Latescibacterota bacterium]